MTTTNPSGLNTVKLIEDFWLVKWPSYSPCRRSIVRGRLLLIAATLLNDPVEAQDLVRHVRRFFSRPNGKRPEPTSPATWAASYLIEEFLPRPWAFQTTAREPMSAGHEAAAQWLNDHSMPASAITDIDLVRLRKNMGGTAYNTRRNYWTIVLTLIHWGLETHRLNHNPSIGVPKLRRVIEVDRPNPVNVPSETDIWRLAEVGSKRVGPWFGVAVLIGSYGALRSGEVMGLRRENFRPTTEGGCWITVAGQNRRFSVEHSDDGISTSDYAPPKARVQGAGRRTFYIPARVASHVLPYVTEQPKGELLFHNRFGNALNAGTFRYAWDRAKEEFPRDHQLRRATPHSMRHIGMTMWLRQGLDLKLIQSWGGWNSLKVMLDTYAELLPRADDESVALLEGRGTLASFSFASSPVTTISDGRR